MNDCRPPKLPISKKLLTLLIDCGFIRPEYTGEVSLTIHMNQGGITDAKFVTTQKIK